MYSILYECFHFLLNTQEYTHTHTYTHSHTLFWTWTVKQLNELSFNSCFVQCCTEEKVCTKDESIETGMKYKRFLLQEEPLKSVAHV